MKNKADYSKYKCPYSHLEKDCGHELHGPEGCDGAYGVWCACGFHGPVFYLDPKDLNLEKVDAESCVCDTCKIDDAWYCKNACRVKGRTA